MQMKALVVAVAAAAVAIGAGTARGDTMHPVLVEKLRRHGRARRRQLAVEGGEGPALLDVSLMTKGITGASVRDAPGMAVAKLGPAYKAKGCGAVPMKALNLIESKPASYTVWVDTKGHPGDLRGKLFAGMAHM